MKAVYLILAIVGAVLPLYQFVPWVVANGLDLRLLLSELFANRISSFFAWDVIVSAAVVFVAIADKPPRFWWAPALGTLCIGVSFGLPLLLYLRHDSTK